MPVKKFVMDDGAALQLMKPEYGSLREELRGLKNCPVNFLTFAVTGTGAVLGFGAGGSGLPGAVAYAAPLLICRRHRPVGASGPDLSRGVLDLDPIYAVPAATDTRRIVG